MATYLDAEDKKRIEQFYKKQKFQGTILEDILAGNKKKAGEAEPIDLLAIKKKPKPAGEIQDDLLKARPDPPLLKPSAPQVNMEVNKRIKEDSPKRPPQTLPEIKPLPDPKPHTFVVPPPETSKILVPSVPLLTPKPLPSTPIEQQTTENNYKNLVCGLLAGITAEKLESKPSRFFITTEEARVFLKKCPKKLKAGISGIDQ